MYKFVPIWPLFIPVQIHLYACDKSKSQIKIDFFIHSRIC